MAAPSPAAASPSSRRGLGVAEISASSTMRAGDTACCDPRNLSDGDPATTWQPAGRGPAFSWVRIRLDGTYLVDGLIVRNGNQRAAETEEIFMATGRVRTAWVLFDDGSAEVIRLDPRRRGPQRVILSKLYTTQAVTLVIRDFELGERWNHVTLSEVSVTGQAATNGMTQVSLTAKSPICGEPRWSPFRDAVVRYCGAASTSAGCEDPVLDLVVRCRSDAGIKLPSLKSDGGSTVWSYAGRWFDVTITAGKGRGSDALEVRSMAFTPVASPRPR
ncbi:MAG: hypothetical protein ACI9MR_001132 [Myxococcota bacterium]|jgi:hypothetical protein